MAEKKRIQIGVFFIVLSTILFLLPLSIKAVDKTAKISFGTAEEKDGAYKIPLLISENEGIMGYYITVNIQSETAVIKGAERGSLSEKGVFDYNILDGSNAADILWAGTDEVSKNGILAYVLIADEANFQKECELSVSCLQSDTFDGNYQEVRLDGAVASIQQEKEHQEVVVKEKEDGQVSAHTGSGERGYQAADSIEIKKENGQTNRDKGEEHTSDSDDTGVKTEKDSEKPSINENGAKASESSEATEETEGLDLYATGDKELDSTVIWVDEKIGQAKDKPKENNFYWIVIVIAGIGALAFFTLKYRKRR